MIDLRKALAAAKGYMLNAVIDLETGTKKQTTLDTLRGGIRLVDAALAEPEWRDMASASKNRTSVLLLMKDTFPVKNRDDLDRWRGVQFVGRHPGLADDGFDIGWSVAAPVGHGGFPDDWFVGWRPLPSPPEDKT